MSYKDDDDGREKEGFLDDNNNEFKKDFYSNSSVAKKSNNDFVIKSSNYDSKHLITNSYFCFKCGAIMTTKDDQIEHEKFELYKSQHMDLESGH
jgi:hypothetical protein